MLGRSQRTNNLIYWSTFHAENAKRAKEFREMIKCMRSVTRGCTSGSGNMMRRHYRRSAWQRNMEWARWWLCENYKRHLQGRCEKLIGSDEATCEECWKYFAWIILILVRNSTTLRLDSADERWQTDQFNADVSWACLGLDCEHDKGIGSSTAAALMVTDLT